MIGAAQLNQRALAHMSLSTSNVRALLNATRPSGTTTIQRVRRRVSELAIDRGGNSMPLLLEDENRLSIGRYDAETGVRLPVQDRTAGALTTISASMPRHPPTDLDEKTIDSRERDNFLRMC